MTLSLRARLFAAQALAVAVAVALATAFGIQVERRTRVARHLESLARSARNAERTLAGRDQWPDVARTLGALLGVRVTLMDRAGRVRGDSDVPAGRLASVENHAGRPEMREALAGREGRAVRHSHTLGRDLVYVAVPVRSTPDLAVLRLAEPAATVRELGQPLIGTAAAAGGAAFLVSLPLLWWITRRQTARTLDLKRAALSLAAGEPGARARELPEDELGRLGSAINHMAREARSRLEALVRERDEREAILAHMRDGVALIDGEGRVVRMNHSMAELIGAARPAESGTPFREFVRAPELAQLLDAARAESRTVEADLRLLAHARGLVHATVTPLGGPKREALLLVIHDLSEAERVDRVRQDFVANVSHELRTPLTSLRGYAETLLDGGLEDVENREGFVRTIHDQAVRLESLAADLLSLADLERPDARLRVEAFDLREAVERQAAAFRDRARRAGLVLEVEPGGPLPVRADRERLDQVIANLVDNALKYTESGRVAISLGADGARVWCEVHDTGPGIPPDDVPRVFERFYRVDKARSREKGGTGLGLAIVKHIVVLHGGEVSVQSRLGEGSTFRFEIPRAPAAPS